MGRRVERAFKKAARRRGLKAGTPRYNAYVWGGMQKRGLLKPKRMSLKPHG